MVDYHFSIKIIILYRYMYQLQSEIASGMLDAEVVMDFIIMGNTYGPLLFRSYQHSKHLVKISICERGHHIMIQRVPYMCWKSTWVYYKAEI